MRSILALRMKNILKKARQIKWSRKALFLLDVVRLIHQKSTTFPHFSANSPSYPQLFHKLSTFFDLFERVFHIFHQLFPHFPSFPPKNWVFHQKSTRNPQVFHINWRLRRAPPRFALVGPRPAGSKGRAPFYQPTGPLGFFPLHSGRQRVALFSQKLLGRKFITHRGQISFLKKPIFSVASPMAAYTAWLF